MSDSRKWGCADADEEGFARDVGSKSLKRGSNSERVLPEGGFVGSARG